MVDRVWRDNASDSAPSAPSDPSEGYPTEGNPSQGVPATQPGAYWFHMITQELREVVQFGGLTPDHTKLDQAKRVIERISGRTNNGTPNEALAADRVYERCWDTSKAVPVLYYATTADGTVEGTKWTRAQDLAVGIGHYVEVQDDLTGADIPSNAGDAKFILLTAGEDGDGEFNEGLLNSESVSGSSPTITATAAIDHGDSPMDGQTVHLINTEERFLRAGNAGTTQNSQFESHSHEAQLGDDGGGAGIGQANNNSNQGTSDRILETGGDETRPRNIGITYYMRIA